MTRPFPTATLLAIVFASCSNDDSSPSAGSGDETVNANQPGAPNAAGGTSASSEGSDDPDPVADAPVNEQPGNSEGENTDIDLAEGSGESGVGTPSAGDANDDASNDDASNEPTDDIADEPTDADTSISFFVTSQNNTGDLGGIAGADDQCQSLAEAVGSARTWAAYLSAEDGGDGQPVNARDRIGAGPWFNAEGVQIAADLDVLHSLPAGDAVLFLDETGERINGQWAGSPTPNEHDVMTGSDADGNLLAGQTCGSWTSASADGGGPRVGHADGLGPGMNGAAPFNSWNSSHAAPNCTAAGLQQVGGAGKFYCFAVE